MKRKHPTSAAERLAVLLRDRGCVAPLLDAKAGPCDGRIEVDHVRPHPGSITISTRRWMQSVCHHHHADGWATSHRSSSRAYLARVNELAA